MMYVNLTLIKRYKFSTFVVILGRFCEEKLEQCEDNPCLNGALCLLDDDLYKENSPTNTILLNTDKLFIGAWQTNKERARQTNKLIKNGRKDNSLIFKTLQVKVKI